MNEQAIDIVIRAKDEATKALGKVKDSIESASVASEKAKQSLKSMEGGMSSVINTTGALNSKLDFLKEKLKNTEIGSEEFKKLQSSIEVVEGQLQNATLKTNKLQNALQTMGRVAKKATFAMTTALAGVVAFGVKSAISLEQTRVAFENLYGDAGKARDMMQSLSDFAKKTPFEFPELTDVALKLKNVAGVGDKELIPMLTNLGDIASSQGKGISQIVEAYNDAITGEYERLKEFGIKASKSGDNVTFSFKGQQQTVKATSEEIGKYLQEVGKMTGISGAMDKQSMTLGGRLSTIKDQFKSLSMAVIGVSETGEIIKGGLFDLISEAVAIVGTYLETNQEEIKTYIQFFIDRIKELANTIIPAVKEITDTLSAFWKEHGETVTEILGNFWEIALALVKAGGDLLGGAIKLLLSILTLDFKGAWEGIQNIVTGVFEFIVSYIKAVFGVDITQYIGDILFGFEQMFTKTFDAIGNFVTGKIDFLKNKAREAAEYLQSILSSYQESSVGQALQSAGSSIYDAVNKERAVGGTVMSGEPVLVGERGPEIIIPKSSSTVVPNNQIGGGANISINFGGVTVRNDGDIQAIARTIEDSLTRKMQLFQKGIA